MDMLGIGRNRALEFSSDSLLSMRRMMVTCSFVLYADGRNAHASHSRIVP